ncbi:UBC-like protein [Clavulina sp. PMI_390]|nr:UBC-like protein [Clavulina sp. PMI_390]
MASTDTIQRLSLEFAALQPNTPEGIYIIPSKQDLLMWRGVFFVHQGFYIDSFLRFRLIFPRDYSAKPPTVIFETHAFHPLISEKDGKMSLTHRFRPWLPEEHNVYDILHFMKSSFKKDGLERISESDCLNREAFRYHENDTSFTALARQTTELSRRDSVLYDNDEPPSMRLSRERVLSPQDGFQFSVLDDDTMAKLRRRLGLTDWSSGDQ